MGSALAAIARYRKGIGAVLTAVGTWGYTATADGHVTPREWFGLLIGLGGAAGVVAVRNADPRALRRRARRKVQR